MSLPAPSRQGKPERRSVPDLTAFRPGGDDREQENGAIEDRLGPERRAEQVHSVEADRKQDDRNHDPGDIVIAGPISGDTQKGGRIGWQEEFGSEGRISGACLAEGEDGPNADEQARDREGGDLHFASRDAGKERNALRSADRIEASAERRVLEHEEHDQREHERQPYGDAKSEPSTLSDRGEELRDP